MININTLEFDLTLLNEDNYSFNSTDNIRNYDYLYFADGCDKGNYISRHAIINNVNFKKVLLIATGGGTGIHQNSYLIDESLILICVSDSIFCIELPNMSLKWNVKADPGTCFGIYKFQNGYIAHGEEDIAYLNAEGKIEWSFSGRDIFTTLDGNDEFIIMEDCILVTDWEGYKYRIGKDGKEIDT